MQKKEAFLIYFFPLTAKHWFSASCNDWGFSQLLSRKDLEDASKGFLVEDTLIVEAEIMVMSTVK
ncbi:ubiquitin carboxyl-terminal hydrolase 12 [Quercus suber]|uniref:Ubiquitin carboxyl-terminal hydrolase 12 n=1 Tax=Quercus suber TaxID=58331 RepID=A0AAW0KRY3_QUESU